VLLPSPLSSATSIFVSRDFQEELLDIVGFEDLMALATTTMAPKTTERSKRTAASKVIKDGRVKKRGTADRITRATTKRTQDA
jgi:hypothetical protein